MIVDVVAAVVVLVVVIYSGNGNKNNIVLVPWPRSLLQALASLDDASLITVP